MQGGGLRLRRTGLSPVQWQSGGGRGPFEVLGLGIEWGLGVVVGTYLLQGGLRLLGFLGT